MADKNLPDVAKMRALLAKLPDGEAKERVAEQIAQIEAESAATPPPAPEPEVEIADVEVEVKEEKPKRGRKPRAKAEPKAKPKKATRFVFEKPVDGGKEVKVVEAMTEAEAKEAMDGTDFEFVKQITRGRSPREGFVADKKAPAKKKEVEKPKSKPRASKKERVEMAKAAGMSETRAERISEKVATGKKRGRKPMDKEAWLFEMPLKTQAGKVKRKIVKATSEKAAIKSAGSSYKLVRKLSEGESPKVGTMEMEGYVAPPKRGRGRPKGAKNKVKASAKPSRMPSKKSQAAIKAKSEDIGEGIAIADSSQRVYVERQVSNARGFLLESINTLEEALKTTKFIMTEMKVALKNVNDAYENLLPDEEGHGLAIKERGGMMAHGGMHGQGYDDKLDESLGMRKGAGRTKEQSRKDRRDESAGMEKSMGRRKFASVGTMEKGRRKMSEGGTTEGKPKVESLTEFFMLMDGTDVAYEDMDDAKKMFGGDPLTPQELVDKLAADHDIYVMDAAPELFDLPDGDDEDDDEFYTGDVKDGVTIDDIEDAIEDQLEADNSYNYSAPFVFDVRFTKTRDAYDPQIMLVREHRGGDVRGNYGDYKAFSIDADTNPFYGNIELGITTNKGDISLRAESLEGYNFYVSSDETGTFEEDDVISRDEIEEALDFGKVKSETLYIND